MIIASPKAKGVTSSSLFFWKDRIEGEVAKSVASLGEKNKLRDACEYSLKTPGKRFRPLIVLLVAEALSHGLDVMEAALCVEFFHTASLIVDDLPSMDDADERRGTPSLHKVFGEATALLASYALISAAFEKIQSNGIRMRSAGLPFASMSDRATVVALESAARCAGIHGATSGQFFDMFPAKTTLEGLKDLIYKKTVALFEVSFVLGWVFGGGALERLPGVRSLAYHMGMAFQVADDLGDMVSDERGHKEGNIALFLGKRNALLLFREEMRQFREGLDDLGLATPSFHKLAEMLVHSLRDVS